jgi:hypothetical protein
MWGMFARASQDNGWSILIDHFGIGFVNSLVTRWFAWDTNRMMHGVINVVYEPARCLQFAKMP